MSRQFRRRRRRSQHRAGSHHEQQQQLRPQFSFSSTLVPPRGGRVELTEIRPIRPNQDIIIPTMVVMGTGIKFEYKDRHDYRSRNGFGQTDGITQYSGSFIGGRRTGSSPPRGTTTTMASDPTRGLFALSLYDNPVGGRDRMIHSSPSPNLLSDFQLRRSPFLDSGVPPAHFGSAEEYRLRTQYARTPRQKPKYAFGRTYYEELEAGDGKRPAIKYHNYVYVSDDEKGDSDDGRTSARRKGRGRGKTRRQKSPMTEKESVDGDKSENSNSISPTTRQGLNGVYDNLFQRHLKVLKDFESDTEKSAAEMSGADDPNDDVKSTSESERLSALGEELVSKSLEEVAGSMRGKAMAASDTPAAAVTDAEDDDAATLPSSTPRSGKKVVTFEKEEEEEKDSMELSDAKSEPARESDSETATRDAEDDSQRQSSSSKGATRSKGKNGGSGNRQRRRT